MSMRRRSDTVKESSQRCLQRRCFLTTAWLLIITSKRPAGCNHAALLAPQMAVVVHIQTNSSASPQQQHHQACSHIPWHRLSRCHLCRRGQTLLEFPASAPRSSPPRCVPSSDPVVLIQRFCCDSCSSQMSFEKLKVKPTQRAESKLHKLSKTLMDVFPSTCQDVSRLCAPAPSRCCFIFLLNSWIQATNYDSNHH